MARTRSRTLGRPLAVAVTTAAVVAAGLAAPVAAGALPSSPSLAPGLDATRHSVSGATDARHALPAGVPTKGSYAFLLELDVTSTATAQRSARPRGAAAARTAARTQLTRINSEQSSVVADLPKGSQVLYRTHAALAGVAVRTKVSNFGALSDIDGVSAVYPIAPKKPTNSTAVPLQNAPQAWAGTGGNLGEGATIAVIDSGIDYTHADFGGPGTAAAYKTAQATEGQPADPNLFPNAKVVGGYDLVGDAYNPGDPSDPAGETPHDDPNPLDCEGHGSHVAGSAAGLGVNADGSTYTGSYNTATQFDSLKIGPGMAPEAKLLAYRVFGCKGSTDLTSAAIDRALDPNRDGNTSDHADIANLSLGADFGSPQDGDSLVVEAASKAGMTMVIASGNNGDLYDTGGTPGNAPSALTVAASQDRGAVVDTLKVSAPAAIAGGYAAERSLEYPWATKPDLTGKVAALKETANLSGCTPLDPIDAAAVNGKIAFAEWHDAAPKCGSAVASKNLAQAGAIGFVFGSDAENFSADIGGSKTIPGVLAAKSGADKIRSQLANGATVTIGGTVANGLKQDDPTLNDTLADFSSRGVRSAGGLKPDVTAVGSTVFSVAVGTGAGGVSESGTSMATPMTAGLAGLVKTKHPTWTPEQIKAGIVNTAGQDLFTGKNHSGTKYAPNRVGTGRIDAEAALDNSVLAYVPGSGSASFGPLEVTADLTRTQSITVENTGAAPVTYNTSTLARTTIPGVSYAVSPSSITVDGNSKGSVTLTLTITKAKLTKTIDPTVDREQAGVPRDYLADASGLVVLTPVTGTAPSLRVAYYSAPRPASTMTQQSSLTLPGGVSTATLPLTGGGIDQGAGDAGITSAVAGFELQATSPALPSCSKTVTTKCTHYPDEKAADLKYVGATSSAPQVRSVGGDPLADGVAYFAIGAQGPWRSPDGSQGFDIYLDTDGDGVTDFDLFTNRLTGADVFVASLYSYADDDIVTSYPINDRFGDVDTAIFDSDTMVLPVPIAALGVTAGNSRVTYAVESYSGASGLLDTVGAVNENSGAITNGLSFDVLRPGVAVYGSFDPETSPVLYADLPGSKLTVRRDAAAYALDKGQGALLVHFHNTAGQKARVLTLATGKVASKTSLSVSPRIVKSGQNSVSTIAVTGGSGTPTGTVYLKAGSTVVGKASLVGGKAKINYKRVGAATVSLRASYAGSASYTASTSAAVTLRVVKVAPAVKLAFSPATVKVAKATTATVSVRTTAGASATGTFTLRLIKTNGKTSTVASGKLVRGTAKVKYTPKKKGTFRYAVYYNGDKSYLAGKSGAVKLKVT